MVHNVGADRRVELLHNEMQVLPRAARPRALLVEMKAGRDLCGMKPRALFKRERGGEQERGGYACPIGTREEATRHREGRRLGLAAQWHAPSHHTSTRTVWQILLDDEGIGGISLLAEGDGGGVEVGD